MARRASSGISLGQIAGIAFAILGFFVIAGLIVMLVLGDFLGGSSASSGGGAGRGSAVLLDLDAYIQDANSLRGNVYRIEGKVEETLRWTSDRGRLISFEASDDALTTPVPVLVPEEFSRVNIERGSEMDMVVRVDREGTLVAEGID